MKKALKTCSQGHRYYKSSDCPTCPICENERTPQAEFMLSLGAPARRALENAGIMSLAEVAKYTEKELLKLHGLGPSTLPKLKKALAEQNLRFKK